MPGGFLRLNVGFQCGRKTDVRRRHLMQRPIRGFWVRVTSSLAQFGLSSMASDDHPLLRYPCCLPGVLRRLRWRGRNPSFYL